MKSKIAYRILIYVLILSVFASMLCLPVYAEEQSYIAYNVTAQPDGLFLTGVTYDDGKVGVTASLGAEKMTSGYNGVTFAAFKSDGTQCAVREKEPNCDGTAEFTFRLESKTVGGTYTFNLSSANTETLVSTVTIFDSLSDAISEVRGLIDRCDSEGITTDYERVYLSTAERSAEIMQEVGISDEIISYNRSVCYELLDKARTNLIGYLDGTNEPYSVPKIEPESVRVSGKNLVGTVLDGGVKYNSPVFLNGYNIGWENRDDSGFLSRVGVNTIPYSININRVIGKPNTAYMWVPSGTAATDGPAFVRGDDGTLKIQCGVGANGMVYQMVSLNANEKYTVRFKAKGEASGKVRVSIGTSGQTDFKADVQSSDDWTNYEYTYTPNNSYNPEFRISVGGAVSGEYIDNISLMNESGEELLSNGGFEEWFEPSAADNTGLFGVNTYAAERGRQALEDYKSKGYTVVLSGEFAAMPTYVLRIDGVRDTNASYGTYVPYNPTHPMILGAIKTYLASIIPIAKECGNVVCFMIHNEPSFNSYGKSFYADKWAEYLKNKYSDISNLNSAYNSGYTSFEDVPMQNTDSLTAAQKLTLKYYDWRVFNDSILTEYHNIIKGYTADIDSGMNVGTKVMQEVSPGAALVQHHGTDYEAFGVNMTINANDGWARPDAAGQPIQAQMMWYDFQTSVNKAPVFNMENHFALDKNTVNYSTEYADWLTAMLWQGAVHGLSGSQTWLWGRSDEKYPDFINTTVQYRADVMAQIGKTGLDINRLMEEVTAFREKTAKSAILFSETAKSYNRQYENALYQSYLGAMYSGVKTDLICESKIDNLSDYEMLIIPEVTHTTDAVVDEIYNFVQNGGKVLVLSDDCLKYNSDGQERANLDKVNAIKNAAATVSGGTRDFTGSVKASVSDIEGEVKAFYKENNAVSVELTDTNSNPVTGVEISTAEKSGKVLINLCNYTDGELSVYVDYNNVRQGAMKNLIDNGVYDGTVTLKPNMPMLLSVDGGTSFDVGKPTFGKMEFDKNPFSPDGIGGTVSKSNITSLSSGNVFASIDIYNCADKGGITLVAAIKNENMLKSVSAVQKTLAVGNNKETVVVDASDLKPGDYLELFVWRDNKIIPLAGTYKLKYS